MRTNFKIMVWRKSFWFSFGCMMLMAVGVYGYYALRYAGHCVDEVSASSCLYYLFDGGDWSDSVWYLMVFLVVLPYANSFVRDQKYGTGQLFLGRTRRGAWYASQASTAFLGTFLVVLVPSLFNILLNHITFAENGNYQAVHTAAGQYTSDYFRCITGAGVERPWPGGYNIIFEGLFCFYPELYNVVFAFLLALVMSVFAVFTYGLSLLVGKGRLYIYLVPFVIVQLLGRLDTQIFYSDWPYVNTYVIDYVSPGFGIHGCYYPILFAFCGLLVLLAVCFICMRVKRDER